MSLPLRTALVLSALLAAPALALVPEPPGLPPLPALPALPGGPAGNGVLMMVHGRFEPRVSLNPDPNGYPLPPPLPEAVAVTQDDGLVHLAVIPHDATTARPMVVEAPRLRIASLGLLVLEVAPNADPAAQRECREETNIPGFEGPLEACLAFALPPEAFHSSVVTLQLRYSAGGVAGIEDYDLAAHGMIHNFQNGAPVDLALVDGALTVPTPFVVEQFADPVA